LATPDHPSERDSLGVFGLAEIEAGLSQCQT